MIKQIQINFGDYGKDGQDCVGVYVASIGFVIVDSDDDSVQRYANRYHESGVLPKRGHHNTNRYTYDRVIRRQGRRNKTTEQIKQTILKFN